ncbi:MAG TPA: hypothetical protein VF763_01350 [Candidatus Limnocylindrales bacterium]
MSITARRRSSGSDGSAAVEPRPKNATTEERRFIERHKAELSKTTLRAKWTHSPDEHEDRAGQTLATRSPDVIRRWAEDRRAKPATTSTIREGERPRTLRFDFPADGQDGRGSRLKPIDWEAWLGTFQDRDLVFLYQEHRRNGGDSNFFRLDSPRREQG